MRRLTFIRHALGVEVEDIRALLAMMAERQASCHQADGIALRHRAEVERRIAQLTALRAELQRMVDECSGRRLCDCCVIEVLADHGQGRNEHHHLA